MTDLSPAAQSVFNAAWTCPIVLGDHLATRSRQIAAALRAAADQADPKRHIEDIDYVHQMYTDGCHDTIATFLSIAAELDNTSPPP